MSETFDNFDKSENMAMTRIDVVMASVSVMNQIFCTKQITIIMIIITIKYEGLILSILFNCNSPVQVATKKT